MIKLAIPNKGRMVAETSVLLEKVGLEIPKNVHKLYTNTNNPNIQIVYARAADIPLYVESGTADLGISGEDMVVESKAKIKKMLKLNFGNCKIVIAVPRNSKIKGPADYKKSKKMFRVATKLTNTTLAYFERLGVKCSIMKLSGALELAPYLGIADAIVDQISTGITLAANNLRVVDVISESSMWLIANPKSIVKNKSEIDELKISIESVISAESKKYIMMNVKNKNTLKRIIKIIPCMESPTVMKLSKKGEFAIHSVVESSNLMSTLRKLKQAGAIGILVMNISKVVE